MSLNTIQDLERYSIVVRLEQVAFAGQAYIDLRSTPTDLVGAELYIEPHTARAESRTVLAVSEHRITLSSGLTYNHDIDAACTRMDLVGLLTPSNFELASDVSATDSEVTVNSLPNTFSLDQYIVIDPFTVEAEARRITSIDGYNLGFNQGLVYDHSAGDSVMFLDGETVINAKWYGARGDGTTDDRPALRAALADTKLSGSKRMYIPAGTYLLSNIMSGQFSYGNYPGLEIFGDGMGLTILEIDDFDCTGNITIFNLMDRKQKLTDLTIHFNAITFSGGDKGISTVVIRGDGTAYGAFEAEVKRIEVYNLIGYSGMSGSGSSNAFSLYAPWSNIEYQTTLQTEVAAPGAQAVELANMEGFRGKGIRVYVDPGGGNEEEVIISTADPTTITATFANTHVVGETVEVHGQAYLGALLEDCYVHDCNSQAYTVNANGNIFRRCKAINGHMGDVKKHGFYIQGGNNQFLQCWVESWSGYHFHGYKTVQRIEQSGDLFDGCVSINPHFYHFLSNSYTNDTNPEIPVGAPQNRYLTIKNCLFRHTNGYVSDSNVIGIDTVPCIIENNIFEDTFTGSSSTVIGVGNTGGYAQGSIIANNKILTSGMTPLSVTTPVVINVAQPYSVIKGNSIYTPDANLGNLTVTGDYCIIEGNQLFNAGINFGGSEHTLVLGNTIVRDDGGAIIYGWANDIVVKNNIFATSGGNINHSGAYTLGTNTGLFEDNYFSHPVRWQTTIGDYTWRNNRGAFALSASGASSVPVLERSGALKKYTVGGAGITRNRLMKLVANALVEVVAGTDVDFIGVCISDTNAANPAYIVTEVDAEVTIDADGAWTAGNYGVISAGSNGKITDNGATKGAGSYVLFLDTGGGAGVATCRILKTL